MKKKLIEVALPLEAINNASALEKSARKGHPSTLHLWWARRPLAACRAVLFASLVDDPSSLPEQFPTEASQDQERQRLFRLIEKLVLWENSNNRAVLDEAHAEILKSTGGNPPPVYDPFCGGGSIPLEAQRLGLEAHGSDLNPVAVLITKALIEIPPKFAGQPPVNQAARKKMSGKGMWTGARGLANDVRHYGEWMRDRAFERIGHLYPKVELPKEHGGGDTTIIAWLWARTILCPNPACGAPMPLVRSFALSTKPGKTTWAEPIINHAAKSVRFEIRAGAGKPQEGTKQRGRSRCLFCGNSITDSSLREQAKQYGTEAMPICVVAEGPRRRLYLPAEASLTFKQTGVEAPWLDQLLPNNPRWFSPPGYGLPRYIDLFTPRQLAALATFSSLTGEARQQVIADGGSQQRADAIATYLALAIDRLAMTGNNLVRWNSVGEKAQHAFGRQAMPMIWDFAEPNFFANATGSASAAIELVADPLDSLGGVAAEVKQIDATTGAGLRGTVFVYRPDRPLK